MTEENAYIITREYKVFIDNWTRLKLTPGWNCFFEEMYENANLSRQVEAMRVRCFWLFKRKLNKIEQAEAFHKLKAEKKQVK